MLTPQSVTFNITRKDPELLAPFKITPNEFKELSTIDQTLMARHHASVLQIYRRCDQAKGKDPAQIIKEAIAHALVYYYPLAGRVREISGTKMLVVECTGEGVMFTEAVADCSVNSFGEIIHPPFPGVDELLCSPVHNSITDSPLMHFQVTKFKCGGFVLGTTLNHVLLDGIGLVQFMMAVSEIARGFTTPSMLPVWERNMLRARDPPQITFEHYEFKQEANAMTPIFNPKEKLVEHTFLFDSPAVSSLRRLNNDPNFPYCSTFELISAACWRARALSLKLDPTIVAYYTFAINARNKINPILLPGYYGNVAIPKIAMTTVAKLKENSTRHAIEVIKKAKEDVNEEFVRSSIDLYAHRGLMLPVLGNNWFISDIRRLGLHEIDYGWGRAAYGGSAKVNQTELPGMISFFLPVVDHKGEMVGIAVPISLSEPIMQSFINELTVMMGRVADGRTWKKTTSTLFRWARLLK